MVRICQFAVAAIGGLFLSAGLIGCSHDRPESVGANAVLAVEGNKTLTYTAPSDGTATVYDAREDDVLWSGKVNKGQSVVADVEKDRILVDGRLVSNRHMDHLHDHKIYFEPSATTVQDTSTTVTHTTHTDSTHTEDSSGMH
jgi:hypothetical protein